jgi:hypothetical protein
VVADTYNPRTQEAEAEILKVQGQPGSPGDSEILSPDISVNGETLTKMENSTQKVGF